MEKINVYFEIGKRVHYLRNKKGWSQEDLAFYAKCTTHYVSDLENGRRNPTISTLNDICIALGVTLEYFFKGINGNLK